MDTKCPFCKERISLSVTVCPHCEEILAHTDSSEVNVLVNPAKRVWLLAGILAFLIVLVVIGNAISTHQHEKLIQEQQAAVAKAESEKANQEASQQEVKRIALSTLSKCKSTVDRAIDTLMNQSRSDNADTNLAIIINMHGAYAENDSADFDQEMGNYDAAYKERARAYKLRLEAIDKATSRIGELNANVRLLVYYGDCREAFDLLADQISSGKPMPAELRFKVRKIMQDERLSKTLNMFDYNLNGELKKIVDNNL